MTPATEIADDTVVTIHFSLHLDSGRRVDSSEGQEPMLYLHGHGNIVPGLEAALLGKRAGEKLAVVVSPADGYGDLEPGALQEVPRDAFPDDFDLSPGASFATEDEDGTVTPFWVVSVVGDAVKITNNHPLAGQNLNFSIEILSIRAATAEEIEHGHPHGEHGHDHHHH